jgi:protein-disulfide isomerase
MPATVTIHRDDHMIGGRDAAIVLVEYGDYQCPYCRRAHAAVKDLQRRLGDQLLFVYRHFPLTNMHPYAEMAAETAEAAGVQGRFWDMHDALFELQPQFGPHLVEDLADMLEIDHNQLLTDLKSRRFQPVVERMAAEGTHLGAAQTPTFFINGEEHMGDSDEASLAEAIMRHVA